MSEYYNDEHNQLDDTLVTNNIIYKPYRTLTYTNNDQIYAERLRIDFNSLPNNIKETFDNFTHNLMSDEKINRYLLLNAIDDFKRDNYMICYNSIYWTRFEDMAFN